MSIKTRNVDLDRVIDQIGASLAAKERPIWILDETGSFLVFVKIQIDYVYFIVFSFQQDSNHIRSEKTKHR